APQHPAARGGRRPSAAGRRRRGGGHAARARRRPAADRRAGLVAGDRGHGGDRGARRGSLRAGRDPPGRTVRVVGMTALSLRERIPAPVPAGPRPAPARPRLTAGALGAAALVTGAAAAAFGPAGIAATAALGLVV